MIELSIGEMMVRSKKLEISCCHTKTAFADR